MEEIPHQFEVGSLSTIIYDTFYISQVVGTRMGFLVAINSNMKLSGSAAKISDPTTWPKKP